MWTSGHEDLILKIEPYEESLENQDKIDNDIPYESNKLKRWEFKTRFLTKDILPLTNPWTHQHNRIIQSC